jgi:serine/threonine-protein kinase RsbW
VDGVVELEIPAKPEFVALARLVVSSFATTTMGLPDDRIDDLKIAVSEACTNAIEAHDAKDTDERVLVRCIPGERAVEIVIADRGSGFDPGALPEHPPVTDPARLKYERGLGIPLIRSLVDELAIDSSDGGTSVRILMRRDDDLDLDLGDRTT